MIPLQFQLGDKLIDSASIKPATFASFADCIIAALARLKDDVRCKAGEEQFMALKFAVHFVGDIQQPLRTLNPRLHRRLALGPCLFSARPCKTRAETAPPQTSDERKSVKWIPLFASV